MQPFTVAEASANLSLMAFPAGCIVIKSELLTTPNWLSTFSNLKYLLCSLKKTKTTAVDSAAFEYQHETISSFSLVLLSQTGLHYSIKVGRLTDFDTAKTYAACTKHALQLVATAEDGAIRLFTLPHPDRVGETIELKTVVKSPTKDYCLVRMMRYGSMD